MASAKDAASAALLSLRIRRSYFTTPAGFAASPSSTSHRRAMLKCRQPRAVRAMPLSLAIRRSAPMNAWMRCGQSPFP
jgi:hypothetical protein